MPKKQILLIGFMSMMKTIKQWVILHDELPRIGSGFRHINVSIGKKWAHVQCVVTKVRQRIKLTRWKEIERGMKRYLERNG
jgi:hypothetical protein